MHGHGDDLPVVVEVIDDLVGPFADLGAPILVDAGGGGVCADGVGRGGGGLGIGGHAHQIIWRCTRDSIVRVEVVLDLVGGYLLPLHDAEPLGEVLRRERDGHGWWSEAEFVFLPPRLSHWIFVAGGRGGP